MTPLDQLPDRIVLALLILGEARGETIAGWIAVACVVRNRLKRAIDTAPHWRDICLAHEQFSCFNPDSAEAGYVQRTAAALMTAAPTADLAQALWVADGVMSGAAKDNTGGATHYLVTSLLHSAPPSWAANQPVLAAIGAHSFLKVA